MSDTDQVSYGRRARLRVALSSQAAEVADSARGLVPTHADGYANGGEYVQAAANIAADARRLLEVAVAYERRRGTSWEIIGETLGISRQAAHDRFSEAEKRLNAGMVTCWLLGDDPRHPGVPYGIADPAEAAGILDRWVTRHLQVGDVLAGRPEDDPERQHAVSRNLPPMDTLENSALVLSGSEMIRERWRPLGADPDDPPGYAEETGALELGLTRRKVEFYERMLAEGSGGSASGLNDADALRDALAGARARLAELESAPRD